MPTLIMTMGLPRSGKSTWAREYMLARPGVAIVNPDSIRLAIHGTAFDPKHEPRVWATAHDMVDALFLAGHTEVILDATNLTKARRNEWRVPKWRRALVDFSRVPASECVKRAIKGDRDYLVDVIVRMSRNIEPPEVGEFDVIFQEA